MTSLTTAPITPIRTMVAVPTDCTYCSHNGDAIAVAAIAPSTASFTLSAIYLALPCDMPPSVILEQGK